MPEDFDRRRILVVDDEERMVRFIRMNLEHDGFQVAEAFNGKQAIQKMRDVTPDLILLDVMMPDIDGFEVLETIREASSVPVIMLTAKGEEDDRVRGLELGADDYITKPFSPREMVSRVKAVIRRTEGAGGSMHDLIEVDERLKIDFDRREVWLEGKLVARVERSADMSPGVVSLPHGWGHDQPGAQLRVAAERPGVNLNALLDPTARDALSGEVFELKQILGPRCLSYASREMPAAEEPEMEQVS